MKRSEIVAGLTCLHLLLGTSALAQVQSDGSTGTQVNFSTIAPCSDPICTITGGTQAGRNLFHSLSLFNLQSTQTGRFVPGIGVQNILTRITGGLSTIDGRIQVDNNGLNPNLFLINPAGIIFGANAQLNVPGSFVATTATAIGFPNGEQFVASMGGAVPSGVLDINPSAFLFNNAAARPAPITVTGSQLVIGSESFDDPASLLLIGGDVTVNQALLSARGGRIQLGGLATEGTVSLEYLDFNGDPIDSGKNFNPKFPATVPKANVSIADNSFVRVDANPGDSGGILVNADSFTLTSGSQLFSGTQGIGDAGLVFVQADTIVINNKSTIFSTVENGGTGFAGGIWLQAKTVSLSDRAQLQVQVNQGARGFSGDVLIQASENVVLDQNSIIFASTFATDNLCTVLSNGCSAGRVFIDAPQANVSITNQSVIQSIAGAVDSSGVTNALGQAGGVAIEARSISLDNQAFISTSTFTQNPDCSSLAAGGCNAGIILLQAEQGSVTINNGSAILSSVGVGARGNAGGILIQANSLAITNGGSEGGGLTTETNGFGDAGAILLQIANDIVLQGSNTPPAGSAQFEPLVSFDTGIFSIATLGSQGAGGVIGIAANSLTITDSAGISTSSGGTGGAGGILIRLSGDLRTSRGGIAAAATEQAGGDIDITARNIFLTNGSIVSTSVFGGGGQGGNITFRGNDPRRSQFRALNDSDILTTGVFGPGGNIRVENFPIFLPEIYTIVAPDFVNSSIYRGNQRVDISARSQFNTAGRVDVPDFSFLGNALSSLSDAFVNPDQLVAGSCLARRNREQGSFTITGTGGLPTSPYSEVSGWYDLPAAQPATGAEEQPQSTLPSRSGNNFRPAVMVEAPSWQLGDPIQEAEGMIIRENGHATLGTVTQLATLGKPIEASQLRDVLCHPR